MDLPRHARLARVASLMAQYRQDVKYLNRLALRLVDSTVLNECLAVLETRRQYVCSSIIVYLLLKITASMHYPREGRRERVVECNSVAILKG